MAVVEQEQNVNALPNKLNENNDDQKDLEVSDVKSNKSHNELFNDALKFVENEDYNNAVECLANALEMINSEENKINGEDIEFAEYYFEYGKALLNLVQQRSNFIALGGDNGNMDYDDYDDEDGENEVDDEDDEDDNVGNNINNNNEKNDVNNDGEKKENVLQSNNTDAAVNQSEIAKEEKKDDNDNDNADNIKVNAKEELDEIEENEDNQNEAENDGEIPNNDLLNEDRAIAWENLEIARILVEKYLNDNEVKKSSIEVEKYTLLLIDIITYLGQHLLEDDKFNEAMNEFSKALKIIIELKEAQLKDNENENNKQEVETKHNRLISSINFWLYLTANFNEMYNESMKHCQSAIKSLNDRIFFLLSNKLNLDINDVQKKELLNYTKTYLEANKNNMDENNNSIKTELEELTELMGDLVLKLEDCHEIVETQKRNMSNKEENEDIDMENNNNNNNNNNDADLESNPLKAMIAALVSKYGISAEQLESMDNEQEKNEDKNNENQNNLNGVTTIGFGNNNQNNKEEDDDIFELGTFGSSKNKNDQNNKECKPNKSRKRKLNETDIEPNLPSSKKVKLNSVEETRVPNQQKKSE